MKTQAYLELLFNDSSNPCYFAALDTFDLIFINKAMVKKMQAYDEYEGKKCYELIHNRNSPCNFCPMESLKNSEFLEQRIFNEVTQNYHRANSTLMNINDTKICACKYFVAFADEKSQKIPYDKAIGKCVEILNTQQAEQAISDFLGLLGQFYRCDRSFIYEFHAETQALSLKHGWSKNKNDSDPEVSHDQRLLLEFFDWLRQLPDSGIAVVDSKVTTYTEESFERKILDFSQVKNMIILPIKNRLGKVVGFLGLSNRREEEFDPRLVKAIVRFVEENNGTQIMVNELKAVNYLDEQTRFYNRKRYMEIVKEFEDTLPQSLGVLFINLTNLRLVNEKKGFAEGNLLIKQSADFLRSLFSEPFYRITGEEFVCFISDCTEADFFKQVKNLDKNLKVKGAPVLNVGCSWDNGKINVLGLVAEADTNGYDI